jgi:hypothetical protein
MQQFSSWLLSWRLFTVQHVSGDFPPIIRSSMTAGRPDHDTIYLLTAIGLSPGGSTHLHTNNTQNNTNNNRTTQITTNVEECGPCPVFASFTLAFSLKLRKKGGKTSVRVRKTSVRLRKTSVTVQYTYYQNTHTYKTHTNTHTHTHTHTHITKQYKTTTVQIKTNTVQ